MCVTFLDDTNITGNSGNARFADTDLLAHAQIRRRPVVLLGRKQNVAIAIEESARKLCEPVIPVPIMNIECVRGTYSPDVV